MLERRRMNLRRGAVLVCASVFVLTGCGMGDAPGNPLVVAHRMGAGLWPENSRTALHGAIERGFPGIEVDVVLTKDLVPILSHDPWMSREFCTRADGTELAEGERLYIRDYTEAELQSGFLCGGIPQAEHPNALVRADNHVTFAELLDALKAAPQMTVQLDIKYEPEFTTDAPTYAKVILDRWKAAALPNPVYASANLPEVLREFKAEMPQMETTLIWPRFTADTSNVSTALSNELTTRLGFQDLVNRIEDAQADGAGVAWQVADRETIEALKDQGFKVQLWTVNTAPKQDAFCKWPADVLITDYPEDVPCR